MKSNSRQKPQDGRSWLRFGTLVLLGAGLLISHAVLHGVLIDNEIAASLLAQNPTASDALWAAGFFGVRTLTYAGIPLLTVAAIALLQSRWRMRRSPNGAVAAESRVPE